MRALRIIAVACCTLVAIVLSTVLLSLFIILAGFGGNAVLPVDCGVVFGAAITGRNTAGPAIVRRVDGAAALWKEGKVKTLILTGGKGDAWRLSEAAVMRQQAVRSGVDGRDILIEDGARSTKQNIEHSRRIVDEHCESVVAISDQYHLARIRLLAKRLGWGTLRTYGVPDRPERGETWSIIREWAAYVYYAFGADALMQLDEYDDGTVQAGTGAIEQ